MTSWVQRIQPVVSHLWRGEWRAGTLEPARYLYDHELVLVLRGECQVKIENRDFGLGKGDWIIVPPARVHSSFAGPAGVFRVCVHFDWIPSPRARTREICTFPPRRPRPRSVSFAPSFVPSKILGGRGAATGEVLALVEDIFGGGSGPDAYSRNLARAHLLELLTRLLLPPPAIEGRRAHLRIAYAARERLENFRGPDGGIQTELGRLGFSYAHVSRVFRRTFGITPVAYRNAIRLERARALLADPGRTIAEVAYESGFADPAYFTRLYRRQNGVAPSACR